MYYELFSTFIRRKINVVSASCDRCYKNAELSSNDEEIVLHKAGIVNLFFVEQRAEAIEAALFIFHTILDVGLFRAPYKEHI